MRLVNNLNVGTILGQVDYAQINSTRGVNDTGDALADCEYDGSVYVFSGSNATLTDLNVNNDEGNPLAVIPVKPDSKTSLYTYTAAFLPKGEYTITYSCQLDDNEQNDGTVEFEGTQNISVVAGETTDAKLIPLVP